jgi:Protein of unknown function (DUF1822)
MANSNNPPSLVVNLSISTLARHTAQQFADEQVTLYKARQVFLNTLSVDVVRDYLTLMAVETDLSQGDSWNPLMRHCADVADLVVSGVGRLECRPLFESAANCYVPPETWWERMGYIFVRIDPSYTQATLLGFLSQVEQAEVSIGALQSMDDFLAYLHQVRQNPSTLARKYVLLRSWLEGRDTDRWLALSELLAPMKSFSFRGQSEGLPAPLRAKWFANGVSRGKFVRLGLHLIPLAIQIERNGLNRFNLTARVFPCNGSYLIPEGLNLTVLEAAGNIVLQAQARRQDGMLQLRFSGVMGEVFEVRLSLGDRWATKTFMI